MNAFHRLSIATLIVVYVLILVGGIVRSTGSGMGCPDWPKCFGSWVPPTAVTDLPDNYKEMYSDYRAKKNVRFARYLNFMGMTETANALLSDKSVLEESEFDATRTWIEYVNRLVGVIIGLFIIALGIRSLRYWSADRIIVIGSLAALILVVFQGWIGSFVVSTNLTPWTVTVHMLLALILVAVLLFLVVRSDDQGSILKDVFSPLWIYLAMAALLVQVLFGTQVRQAIDLISADWERNEWIGRMGTEFLIHRSFSWMVLFAHVILVYKMTKSHSIKAFRLLVILLILGTVLSGMGMAYLGVPAFLQPIHLLLSTALFGAQVYLLFQMNRRRRTLTR